MHFTGCGGPTKTIYNNYRGNCFCCWLLLLHIIVLHGDWWCGARSSTRIASTITLRMFCVSRTRHIPNKTKKNIERHTRAPWPPKPIVERSVFFSRSTSSIIGIILWLTTRWRHTLLDISIPYVLRTIFILFLYFSLLPRWTQFAFDAFVNSITTAHHISRRYNMYIQCDPVAMCVLQNQLYVRLTCVTEGAEGRHWESVSHIHIANRLWLIVCWCECMWHLCSTVYRPNSVETGQPIS